MIKFADKISVGVAGWSYPDWNGFVYPKGVKDKLQFLAGYVDMIEINSTFYRPPTARNSESWVRRTEIYPDFFFSAKLHQEVTHEGRIRQPMVRAFREGLAPMADAGKLRHLLAQFRYDFDDTPVHREHLTQIQDRFGGLGDMVLELRHKSWEEQGALDYLAGLDVTVANLDYPTTHNSFDLQECRVGRHGYLRLHGRNAAAWFSKDSGRDQTYNYYYSAKERERLVDRAISLVKTFRSLTIVANNHYEGKEVANALQIKSIVSEKRVKVPAILQSRYHELKDIAEDDQEPTLF